MASAITCNFPTWCTSSHRSNCEQWKTVCSVSHLSVHVKCSNSFTSTECHIWKCSLPSSRNVCRPSVSFCAQLASLWNESIPLWHPSTEPLLYTSDPYINTSFKVSSEETTLKPDICFHIAEFYPIFPSTPTNSPFRSPACSQTMLKKKKKIAAAQLDSILTCVCFCEWWGSEVLKERQNCSH